MDLNQFWNEFPIRGISFSSPFMAPKSPITHNTKTPRKRISPKIGIPYFVTMPITKNKSEIPIDCLM